ncbi:uncharacterized protein RAG0_10271 [Rhynchosporium agropyri]|uniref:Uncharacterized protein n=1 Tax=Rhynchosporium agropyri TaxID=914238 RepID=A0A1E1KZ70_9HELO|nr:uncharacterized protein RAG0_10271 [Rhynchosporium agropyri]
MRSLRKAVKSQNPPPGIYVSSSSSSCSTIRKTPCFLTTSPHFKIFQATIFLDSRRKSDLQMADSSLIRAGEGGSGAGFEQQGSVDWVALSGITLTFSIEILSHFSKAGVEMVRIAMGRALFSKFNIKADGQRRFTEAISKLKAVSSYDNLLCFYGSKVLKAMADIQKAPKTMTPSLSQWSSLLGICAGGVTKSDFPHLVNGISRFLSPSQEARECFLSSPTTPEALAVVLVELARVSDGTLHNVTLVGGIDCSRIAAVAQWLLPLRVQIADSKGTIVYKSQGTSGDQFPQVTIFRQSGIDRLGTSIMSRSLLVPQGVCFFHLGHPDQKDRLQQHILSSGRSPWSEILQDSFGETFNKLLSPCNITVFARFLFLSLDLPSEKDEDKNVSNMNPWQCYSTNLIARRRSWLEFTAWRLPELAHLSREAYFDMSVIDSKVPVEDVHLEMLSICLCGSCRNCPPSGSWRKPTTMCSLQLGTAISQFIYTLSWLDMDDALKPSSDGLRTTYLNRRQSLAYPISYVNGVQNMSKSIRESRRSLWPRPIASAIFPLFTGLNFSS